MGQPVKFVVAVVLLGSMMYACGDPPQPAAKVVYRIETHPQMALGWVPPPGATVKTYRGGAPGWTYSLPGSPGGLLLLPGNPDFFLTSTRPTAQGLLAQASRDFTAIQVGLQGLDPIIRDNMTLIAVHSQATQTREGSRAYLRIVDLQLSTLLPAAPQSLRDVLLALLSGQSATAQQLTGEGAVDRYRLLYYLGPVINQQGDWIKVKNAPALVRVLQLVKAADSKKVTWLTRDMSRHFQSGFFGLGKLELVKQTIAWEMPNRQRSYGLVVDIDSSSSVLAGEFNQFLDSVLWTLDALTEQGIDIRLTLLRGCDGTPVKPVASAPTFALGYEAAKAYLAERKKLIMEDADCTLGGFQGFLGLDRLLHTPAPELEDVDQILYMLFTDGDDHSHPLDRQDSISEELVSHYVAEVTKDPRWKMLLVAPGNRCVFDEFSAIEAGSRVIAMADGNSRFYVDVCNRDWLENYQQRVHFLTALDNPFHFDSIPLVPSLSVVLGGKSSNEDAERGWQYDWESASLVFGSLVAVPPGTKASAQGYFIKNIVK